MANIAGIR